VEVYSDWGGTYSEGAEEACFGRIAEERGQVDGGVGRLEELVGHVGGFGKDTAGEVR